MLIKDFEKKWMAFFANGIDQKAIQKYVVSTGNYIWHIFSWELLPKESYLTGDAARAAGASAIIRGVRNTVDFEYERTMAQINRRIYPDITTVMLFTPPALADIASSTVRALWNFKHDVSALMPEGIKLEEYIDQE
jgi:phosphopantetheine adenylyltransferase